MHSLRPYQHECVDAVIAHLRRSTAPILIDAATGAGKSIIIAEIARIIHSATGKKILCLAPSAELVTQNRAKYLAAGNPASMFSASAGTKDLRHHVVFGSPLTVKGRISAFQRDYALVIVDEAHGLTPTLKAIIEAMRAANPNLRVVGLTATPYRMGSGYIFREWPDGTINGEDSSVEPYFTKCVYRVDARDLISDGYLTRPVIGAINAEGYDTHGLALNSRGQFNSADVDRAYHGHGRKTAGIVSDIVAQARERRGVLIFAATVQHAKEVLASLPPEISAIVTGETTDRKTVLKRFLAQKIKYIVNVGVLTTGFDATHVDLVAILRKTESVGLLQQIIGRGLRLHEGKRDCLVLDYTSNLEDHCPHGDLFAPKVKAKTKKEKGEPVEAECPSCGYANQFSINPDCADYKTDKHGYCLDVFGDPVVTEYGPMSAHYGRRCFGMINVGKDEYDRCSYRWTSKPCPHCDEPNDIAARYCIACKGEIVDPGEKLRGEFRAMKRDPHHPQTDVIVDYTAIEGVSSRTGKPTLRIDWKTEYRHFSTWLQPEGQHSDAKREYRLYASATMFGERPRTISYVKQRDSDFFRILGFNMEEDREPA